MAEPAAVDHLLLDADGVVQELPEGWLPVLRRHLGAAADEFLPRLAAAEQPCLRGEAEFLPVLGEHLAGFDVDVATVHREVWERVDVCRPVLELAAALGTAGIGVHLATNQNPERARFMREALGYDAEFDRSFYSCELGATKPGADFFDAVLADLGAAPDEVLLVDDGAKNVAAARDQGLRAEQWQVSDGIDTLRSLLAAHGLVAPGT